MIECTICCNKGSRLLCRKDGASYHSCPQCHVIFQYPAPQAEAMISYADTEYGKGGLYHEYVEAREMKLEHFRRRLARLLPHVPKGRLLDIGCSCGFFMEVAAANGFDVEGLEFSRTAIAAADPAIRPHIFCSSVDEFESAGSYDLITAFDLIEHVPKPKDFLRKVRRLLTSGAWLAMATPDAAHFLRYVMGSSWPMLQPMQHLTIFSRQAMRVALEEAGFSEISFEPATKTISYEYLTDQLRVLTPGLHKGMRFAGQLLPGRTRQKYRNVNIGEFMVLARATSV